MLNIYILTQPETLKIGHEQHFDHNHTPCALHHQTEIRPFFSQTRKIIGLNIAQRDFCSDVDITNHCAIVRGERA